MTTIAELITVCEQRYATASGWFMVLGDAVSTVTHPELQRHCCAAAHRFAWHAELWERRRPAVPHDSVHEMPRPELPDLDTADCEALAAALAARYCDERTALDSLASTADPDLDPPTLRLVALIDADLADLQRRLALIDIAPAEN